MCDVSDRGITHGVTVESINWLANFIIGIEREDTREKETKLPANPESKSKERETGESETYNSTSIKN